MKFDARTADTMPVNTAVPDVPPMTRLLWVGAAARASCPRRSRPRHGRAWCARSRSPKPDQEDDSTMSDQPMFDESTCDRCGRDNPVWSTPVEVWQQVYGVGGQPTRQGVLCPSCFIDDAEAAGVTAPRGTAGWTVVPHTMSGFIENIKRAAQKGEASNANTLTVAAEVEQLRAERDRLVEGIRAEVRHAEHVAHEARTDDADDPSVWARYFAATGTLERLSSLLDTSDDQEDTTP